MSDLLNWLIATPTACATGYLLAKVLGLDALAVWIRAKLPIVNKLPWNKRA